MYSRTAAKVAWECGSYDGLISGTREKRRECLLLICSHSAG